MSGKIDPNKPYLEFTFNEDGSVTGEAHNTDLPLQKCVRLTLDILEEALGKENLETTEVKPKVPATKARIQQQKRQQLGG